MTTAADLVAETRTILEPGTRTEINALDGLIDSATQSVTLQYPPGAIQRGAMLAVNLELMYVWSLAGQVATVQRGMFGSAAAGHADDDLVQVNPRWSDFEIFRALNHEISSYSSPRVALFQMKALDITFQAATVGYDLTSVTDLIEVYELRWKGYTNGEWPRIRGWRVTRDMATSEFASGQALLLTEPAGPGRPIRVRYKAHFAQLANLADNVEVVSGLPESAHDIPPLGAAARLLAHRESKRATIDSQPEPRQAADVGPGTARNAAASLLALRDLRLREEAARLQAQYPTYARKLA